MVELTWQGDVAVVTMDDGENRFHASSVARWHELLDELDAKEGPLAVVTTGSGRFYSNGLDLDWMGANPDGSGSMIRELHRLWGRLLGLGAATVAAVNGHAFGAGALLSSAHDRIVMREDRGYWCMPEVDIALPVGPDMAALLSARLPAEAVHEALVTGRRFGGADALAAGIVAEVGPEEEVLDRAVAWARPLAGKDRSVIATHKRILHGATIDRLLGGR
jgi:enoyl-CoA hydratase/carnithine racemase